MRLLKKILRYGVPVALVGAIVASVLTVKHLERLNAKNKSALLSKMLAKLPESSEEFFKGTVTVAQNDRLTLILDCDTGFISVTDQVTGRTYHSNPADWQSDTRAEEKERLLAASQIEIDFYDAQSQKSSMNSYRDALSLSQIRYQRIHNGVRATYILGKTDARKVLPIIIRVDQMNKLVEKMDEDTREDFLFRYRLLDRDKLGNEASEYIRKYPLLAKENLYELRGTTQERVRKLLEKECIKVGLSLGDIEKEYDAIGYQSEEVDPPFAVIPVDFFLNDDSFCAKVRTQEIIESLSIRVVNIRLLPFFGYADSDEEGYFLVPDGSGALIRFNRTTTAEYSQKLYGEDPAIDNLAKTTYGYPAVMPVFGCSYENGGGFLSVIEQGAANAALTAKPAGLATSYNHIFATFSYRAEDTLALNASLHKDSAIPVIAEKTASTDFSVQYFFLTEEESDYVGMARRYRTYLQSTGVLATKTDSADALPFLLSLYGSTNKKDAVMGVPVTKEIALTTFEEAKDLLSRLRDDKIERIFLQYYGWTGGGTQHGVLNSIQIQPKLGGKSGFQSLSEYAEQVGVGLFPVLDFSTVYQDSWFDGYSPREDSARYINKKLVTLPRYSLVTGLRLTGGQWTGYVASPAAQQKAAARLLKSGTLTASGVSLGSYGSVLPADYHEKHFYDRSDALAMQRKISAQFAGTGSIMISGGIAELLSPQVEHITQIPLSSSGFLSEDESVPFYQLVLHGYVSYTGEPLNLAQNYWENLLRSIETGAGLAVVWIAAENSKILGTPLQDQYAMNADVWYRQVVDLYRDLNQVLGRTAGLEMVGHRILKDGLTVTEYEGGIQVFVNYTESAETVSGVTVSPRWFAVEGGAF